MLDVDSTLCGVEGIDWLARRRGREVAANTSSLTERAMNGEIPLEQVYGQRLALIRPSLDDVDALSEEYRRTMAPDARRVIPQLRSAGVTVILISGGIRQAIEPVVVDLGLEGSSLFAVQLRWDDGGTYLGFDTASPLTRQRGKLEIVRSLSLGTPVLSMGDGSTDIVMREATDGFAAYTGFARRTTVVEQADFEVPSFAELRRLVLGDT